MVTIQFGHHTGEVVPVLSVDSDRVHEVELANGEIAYYDFFEVTEA